MRSMVVSPSATSPARISDADARRSVAITGAPVWPDSPLSWVPAVTATGSISRLLGGEASPLAAVAPASLSFAALLAWILVPFSAAIAWFRRIDLNE